MVNAKRAIGALFVVVIGIVMARALFPSEERKIRKEFVSLSKWMSKGRGETAFTMVRKTKRVGTFFAAPCRFDTPIYSFSGTYTPEEISSYAAEVHLHFSELSLRFYDLDVDILSDDTARAVLTAKVEGRTSTGEYVQETHEVECELRKGEDRWLFHEVRVVEVLKK